MGSYETTIDTLAGELARIAAIFRGLTEPEWAASTRLVPVDPDLPHWTVFELAGHFDISIGLTAMLLEGRGDLQPARDRTSFFINPRSETGPVFYGYAYTMVEGKTPADMPGVLAETFGKTIEEARSVPADAVGPGYFAPMQVDEFVASRVVEAVVHGLPQIAEAAVVGRAHPVYGEEPVLFVSLHPEGTLDTDAIREHLRGSLSKYKLPVEITIMDDIPKNAVGKIDKPTLRKSLVETH